MPSGAGTRPVHSEEATINQDTLQEARDAESDYRAEIVTLLSQLRRSVRAGIWHDARVDAQQLDQAIAALVGMQDRIHRLTVEEHNRGIQEALPALREQLRGLETDK